MILLRAFKTELDPNNEQRTLLAKTAGCARFAYNWGLGRRIAEYKETGKSSNAIAQHKQLNALKAEEFPWMYEVSKCAPQEALRDLDTAYEGFFRRVKNGEKPGFPRFKSKHRNEPKFRINSHVPVCDVAVQLPHMGWVRLKERSYLPVTGAPNIRPTSVSVKGTGTGRWFVSVQCEITVPDPGEDKDAPKPVPVMRTVGVDLGLREFAVTSDGERFPHPHALRKAQ